MSEANKSVLGADAGQKARGLLGRQLALYRRLEQLADAQRRLIESEDTRPLLRLLGERQKLTDSLTSLGAELAPYRDRWDEVRATLNAADRANMDEALGEVRSRLKRVLESDEADSRLLQARKSRTAQSLGKLGTGRQTLAAYGGGSSATGGGSVLDNTEA